MEGLCRAPHSGDEDTGLILKTTDHFSVRVIGIGEKNELLVLADRTEHLIGLVNQGSLVAVGTHDAFVDTGANRNAKVVSGDSAKDAESLERMTHDELGFRIGVGLLMEILHGGHFPAFLRILEAIKNHDWTTVNIVDREALDNDSKPEFGEVINLDSVAVEELKQSLVTMLGQSKCTHETGHTKEIMTNSESG